jgi:tetratricopeptide (TPR) repeat protein
MTIRVLCPLVLLAAVLTAAPQPLRARQDALVPRLYTLYLDGDYLALRRLLATREDLRSARGEIFQAVRDWRLGWKPSQAAFLQELAFIGFDRGWDDAALLLVAARDLALARKSPPGASATDDNLEILLHRVAVTLLIARQRFDEAEAYLRPLATRVSDGISVMTGPRLVDPRIAILRGQVLEMRTAPSVQDDAGDPEVIPSLAIDSSDTATRRRAEQAMALYARVEGQPDTAAEASVRRGFLLFRLGRRAEALAVLTATGNIADATLGYWAALFRGRVLETEGTPDDAAAAYERAAALFPGSQTPAVALASLWKRHDRPIDAGRWAAAVTSGQRAGLDPWWEYWSGDYRLLTTWVAALRSSRP